MLTPNKEIRLKTMKKRKKKLQRVVQKSLFSFLSLITKTKTFFSILELSVRKPSSAAELKRKETTAVVLLGVIGAEFGQDTSDRKREDRRKSSVVEGFNINNNLARLTSKHI